MFLAYVVALSPTPSLAAEATVNERCASAFGNRPHHFAPTPKVMLLQGDSKARCKRTGPRVSSQVGPNCWRCLRRRRRTSRSRPFRGTRDLGWFRAQDFPLASRGTLFQGGAFITLLYHWHVSFSVMVLGASGTVHQVLVLPVIAFLVDASSDSSRSPEEIVT